MLISFYIVSVEGDGAVGSLHNLKESKAKYSAGNNAVECYETYLLLLCPQMICSGSSMSVMAEKEVECGETFAIRDQKLTSCLLNLYGILYVS